MKKLMKTDKKNRRGETKAEILNFSCNFYFYNYMNDLLNF